MINNPFKTIYAYWMKFVHYWGIVNSYIIFSLIYLVFIGIYAIINFCLKIIKIFFGARKKPSTYWLAKKYEKPTVEILERQF
ncbi:MAG: hypothetical protein WC675_02200 [Patescibacteria group bacterium]|jgi:hypothetical protein